MKTGYAVLLFAGAFFSQATIVKLISFGQSGPNLLICLVIVLTLSYKEYLEAVVIGTGFAVLYDLCFSPYFGIWTIATLAVGLSMYIISCSLNVENRFAIALATMAGTFLFNMGTWLLTILFGGNYTFSYVLAFQPLYLLYNVVAALVLHFILMKNHKDRCC